MIGLLTIALAAEPPPVGAGISLQLPTPEVHWLSDGTPVWLIPQHGVPLVRIEVSLRQGYLTASDPLAALLAGGLVGEEGQRIGVGAARVWADIEVLRGGEEEALSALRQSLLQPQLRGRAVRIRRRHLARGPGRFGGGSGTRPQYRPLRDAVSGWTSLGASSLGTGLSTHYAGPGSRSVDGTSVVRPARDPRRRRHHR